MDETLCAHCGEPQGSGSRCANCNERVYRYATDEVVDFSAELGDLDTDVMEETQSAFDPPPRQPASPPPRITPRSEVTAPVESTFPTPRSRPTPGRPKLGRLGIRGVVAAFIIFRLIQRFFD
jgi:hypothetical protein